MAINPCGSTISSPSDAPSPFPARSPRRPGPHLPARRRTVQIQSAFKRDAYGWDYGGGLVNENMIVLRKRIHEMKMAERNYEPPADWMGWEKRYYTSYDSDVCEAVGLLQILLMSTRPSVAIGMAVLLALSVPTSAVLIMFHLMEVSKLILSGMHLN